MGRGQAGGGTGPRGATTPHGIGEQRRSPAARGTTRNSGKVSARCHDRGKHGQTEGRRPGSARSGDKGLETFRTRRVCKGAGPPASSGGEAGDPASASLYGNLSYATDEPLCETETESRAPEQPRGAKEEGWGGLEGEVRARRCKLSHTRWTMCGTADCSQYPGINHSGKERKESSQFSSVHFSRSVVSDSATP